MKAKRYPFVDVRCPKCGWMMASELDESKPGLMVLYCFNVTLNNEPRCELAHKRFTMEYEASEVELTPVEDEKQARKSL